MNVSVSSEELQKKLSFAIHAVSLRNQLPILLHVLLQTKNHMLKITTTDLEIGIETEINAEITTDGGVTVPAKVFLELINTLPIEKITLKTQDTTLEVIGSKSKSKLQGMNKDEFPALYEDRGKELANMKQEVLKKFFTRVYFAVSYDTTRPALSGVLMRGKDDKIILVATDGYRLSLQEYQGTLMEKQDELEKPILIQARVIKETFFLKDNADIKIYIANKTNQVIFSQNSSNLVGRLIEAEYPKYEKILPSDFSTKVFFDREELHRAIKTSAIFARETANIIKLSLRKDKIIISSNAPSVGENIVEIEARLEGEENEIAFNCRYLLDLFANIEENEMTFEMMGPLNPGVFKIANDSSFLHLIMPVRTQN